MEQETDNRLLADPAAADLVVETLGQGRDRGKFRLDAFVVMPNHAHALFFPMADFVQVVKSLKGTNARPVNQALGRTGSHPWQEESFDHWVRDAAEWQKIVRYIERNPVRAGLVAAPEDYRWSSASEWGRTFLSG